MNRQGNMHNSTTHTNTHTQSQSQLYPQTPLCTDTLHVPWQNHKFLKCQIFLDMWMVRAFIVFLGYVDTHSDRHVWTHRGRKVKSDPHSAPTNEKVWG